MIKLEHKDWNPDVKNRINDMMARVINSGKRHYAVVDWDNTFVYMDTSEVLLLEQIEKLKFNMTPSEMNFVLKKGVPKDNYKPNYKTENGKPINIDMIAQDIVNAYTALYNEYIVGNKSLEQIQKMEEYKEFITKYYYNYKAVIASFGAEIGYIWAKYSMTNLTEKEITEITSNGIKKQLKEDIRTITLHSSNKLKSNTGLLKVDIAIGYRFVEPMQELANVLQANGIDLYIISAAYQDVVAPTVSNPSYGYNIYKQNVYAMQFEKEDGRSLPEYKKGYPVTFKEGKSKVIKELIAPKYDNQNPIFTAGDSDGDVAMMTDIDIDTVLVVNRNKGGLIGKLIDAAKMGNASIIVQGRDENTGKFIPTMETIKMKSDDKERVS
ncbi:MAG: haloacid dehalogenase-like hydrolase [Spirochaetales bacterium]